MPDDPYFYGVGLYYAVSGKIIATAILRVDNTEHTQPILFMTIPALPNDGIHAKDIEVCLWLLLNVFRVNACP